MNHEPDPRFLEHLEWQTESALRRKERFARPVPTGALRVARTLALVAVCSLGGAGLVVAAERIQVAREQELLLERNRVQLALAEHLSERAAEDAELLELRNREGLTTRVQVDEAQLEFEHARLRLRLLELDRAEISATGRAPDLQITAPLARGRDILSERVRAERVSLEPRLALAGRLLEVAELRYAQGVAPVDEIEPLRTEVENLVTQGAALEERLALRADHLLGRVTREAALRADRLAEVDLRRAQLERALVHLEQARALADARYHQGAVSQRQLRAAQDDLRAAQAELELVELERHLIE